MTGPFRLRIAGALRAAARAAATLGVAVAPAAAGAQISPAPHASYSGTIDYTVTGASLRPNSDQANPCAMTGQGSATLSSVPAGASIVAAWVYWAGSGPPDLNVKFQGVDIAATRNWTATTTVQGSTQAFFGGARDVTSLVAGNGTYTLSQLAVLNNGSHCDTELVVAGWSLVVVYSSPTLPTRSVDLRDGLGALANGQTSVALTGFGPAATARISVLTWEGDPGTAGTAANPEAVRFNGTTVSSGDNAFNSTVSSTGATNSYGMDFDSYEVGPLLRDDGTATVTLSTGADLVLPQLLVTAMDAAMVDVTPKGLGTPVVRLGGAKYSQQFLVENRSTGLETYDLVARVTGAGFVTIDSIRGAGTVGVAVRPDSLRVSIGARATQAYLVWYTVAPGATADDVLYLRARSTRLPTQAYARGEGWAEIRRGAANLALSKQVAPNTAVHPGIDLTYTMTVSNPGSFPATGIVVSDVVPSALDFRVGSPTATLPAGVTAVVAYSSDGTTFSYTPAAGGCGATGAYDRCVRAVRWTFSGALAPFGAQAASLTFVARVR